MKTITITTTAPAPARYHEDIRWTPLTESPLIELTEEEKKKGCVIFHLSADMTQLGTNIVAVCEPTSVWQWLQKDAVIVYNYYYQWEDELEIPSKQLRSELSTRTGRVLGVDLRESLITTWEEGEENESLGEWFREIWLVTRSIAVAAKKARKAA